MFSVPSSDDPPEPLVLINPTNMPEPGEDSFKVNVSLSEPAEAVTSCVAFPIQSESTRLIAT